MNDTTQATPGPVTGLLTTLASNWNRFLFQPTNPTTIGLIRLCTGLLVFYVYFAYTYDLRELFGKDAWVSLDHADYIRHQTPWVAPSSNWLGWQQPSLFLPEERPARNDLLNWLQRLPDDKAERLRMIEYIKRPATIPVGVYIPKYVRELPPGPPEDFEPKDPMDFPIFASQWQVFRFIRGLPDDKDARVRKIEYIKEWGFDPDQLDHRGSYTWSVWYHVTDPGWMVVTHVAILAIMLLFAVGFCSRITSVLTWLAAVSYINRSQVSLFGGDTMLNILLIYLMIAPSGAALSVDRLLARWWALRQARRAGRPKPEWTPPLPSISANFAQRLIQVHFCVIYMSAGLSKMLGGNWWNGTSIYYTMANYEFAPLNHQFYLDTMHFLAQHRWLWEIVMHSATYGTLMLEIGLPFLVWNKRMRPLMVAASMTLHISIAIFMGLVAFSLLMATMVLAFIPGESVERLLDHLRRRWFGGDLVEKAGAVAGRSKPVDSEAEAASATENGEAETVLHTGEPETAVTRDKGRGKRKKGKGAPETMSEER